jgi:hypothetical protein
MTEDDARRTAQLRAQEQPEHGWLPRQDPITGAWSVAKLAGAGSRRGPIGEAIQPPPPAPHDDPRTPGEINVPPWGVGI